MYSHQETTITTNEQRMSKEVLFI